MDRVSFDLTYDGPLLSGHQMDVRELSPALLGLGNLVRDANQILNSDLCEVRVLVNSEIKPGCFTVSFELWQSLYDAATGFLGTDGVQTAKDILEWLDLLAKPVAVGGGVGALGVLGYYRWRAGRKITSAQEITDTTAGGVVQVRVEGDNNQVFVDARSFQLSHDPRIASASAAVLAPLREQGIEDIETKADGKSQARFSKEDAQAITASTDAVLKDQNILSQATIVAHLTPYDTQFNPDAAKWEFWYGGRHIPVDISGTSIAKDAVRRRVVSMDEVYKVDLQITERRTPSGRIKTDYKVVRLHDRLAGSTQDDMFDPPRPDQPAPNSDS